MICIDKHKMLSGLLVSAILYLPLWIDISLQRFHTLLVLDSLSNFLKGSDFFKKENEIENA